MNRETFWAHEILGICALISVAAIAGFLIDLAAPAMVLALALYLAWHLHQLYRLTLWVASAKRFPPPYRIGIWGSLVDEIDSIRERGRKRKRQLSQLLTGFQESTSALPDATVVLDDGGVVEWWNQAAEEMLALRRGIDRGRRIHECLRDPVFIAYLDRGDYLRPLQMPAPVDDAINLEVRIVPYGAGKRLLQARDITRVHQLETVRRDFVANVSHEMRTPLTVIHGYLETMHYSDDPGLSTWRAIVQQMLQQTHRMQRIVEDLLVLSRLENSQLLGLQEPVRMDLLLQEVLGDAQELSGKERHLISLEADRGLLLRGRTSELDSAFSNLVFNAVRYTPPGGEIRMRWAATPDGGACFSVEDTGIGIAPEHIPRLTERFYRVDVGRSRGSGGTGLGLAIVKHVLTRHGGRLEVRSEPGKGSCFRCCFPPERIVPDGAAG